MAVVVTNSSGSPSLDPSTYSQTHPDPNRDMALFVNSVTKLSTIPM